MTSSVWARNIKTEPVRNLRKKFRLCVQIQVPSGACLNQFFFSLGAIAPQQALASSSFTRIFVVSRSHTTTHHSRQDSSGRVISSSPRPLPDNTQHSQQTNIQALGGIRTHYLSRRAAVDLRLRPRGHWDWLSYTKTLRKLHAVKQYSAATGLVPGLNMICPLNTVCVQDTQQILVSKLFDLHCRIKVCCGRRLWNAGSTPQLLVLYYLIHLKLGTKPQNIFNQSIPVSHTLITQKNKHFYGFKH